jgi:peptidoglycan hydrolase-like protein with peptidoglycan-binding domain
MSSCENISAATGARLRVKKPLRSGSRGRAVQNLQSRLQALGYYVTRAGGHLLPVDGHFGPYSCFAVMHFQSDYGLAADGVAGPVTLEKLKDLLPNLKLAPFRDFPICHRNRDLFDFIQARLPERTPVEVVANAVLHVRQNRIQRTDQITDVLVHNGRVFVVSRVPGFYSTIDLNQAPPLPQTLQRLKVVNGQQRAEWQQQRRQQGHGLHAVA